MVLAALALTALAACGVIMLILNYGGPALRPLVDDTPAQMACERAHSPDPALAVTLMTNLREHGSPNADVSPALVHAYDCGDQAFLMVPLGDCGSPRLWSFKRTSSGWGEPVGGGMRYHHCHDEIAPPRSPGQPP